MFLGNGCWPLPNTITTSAAGARSTIRIARSSKRLRQEIALPIYWGNRNWHPLLPDTLRQMRDDGIRNAIAFFTSAFSSYSGCRQYREDIAKAQEEVGEGAPEIIKIPQFYNNPGFLDPTREHVDRALTEWPDAEVVYTAHSIPQSMADGSWYVTQLEEACRMIAPGTLVYQSRSGAPGQPWLGPDINEWLRERRPARVIIVPIGFISDHMEVLYDLDTEARETCAELGLQMKRIPTVGTDSRFIRMIARLRQEPAPPSLHSDVLQLLKIRKTFRHIRHHVAHHGQRG